MSGTMGGCCSVRYQSLTVIVQSLLNHWGLVEQWFSRGGTVLYKVFQCCSSKCSRSNPYGSKVQRLLEHWNTFFS